MYVEILQYFSKSYLYLHSYIGIVGPANTPCNPLPPSSSDGGGRRLLSANIDGYCRYDSDCFFNHCDNSTNACVIPTKQCELT